MKQLIKILVSKSKYGLCSIIGKIMITNMICKHPELSNEKVKDITNMMLQSSSFIIIIILFYLYYSLQRGLVITTVLILLFSFCSILSTSRNREVKLCKRKGDKYPTNNITVCTSAQYRMYILSTEFHLIDCSHFITVRVHHSTNEQKRGFPADLIQIYHMIYDTRFPVIVLFL